MRYRGICAAVTGALLLGLAGPLAAAELMPDFADVPTGWTTDRYGPASFSNVGTYEGRNDVLGISISEDDGFGNRGGQNSTFYATQGRRHQISGGAGDSLSADLYIESDWATESNGTIRTDMWGTMDDGTNITAYPIIGFTNLGNAARFRVWDGDLGDWVDLAAAVQFGEWNSLSMVFDGSDFIFSVNGAVAYTDATTGGTTAYREVIMQAYNFFGDDPAFAGLGLTPVEYTAHWANVGSAAVPAPGTLALAAAGLLAFGARRRRLH
jgi:MYXO-CTERM domain-containing protein